MIISSTDNSKIKEINKLNISKYRKQENKFLVEGKHLVEEAYKNNLLIEILSLENITYFDIPVNIVTNDIMKKISNLDNAPSIIGVCKMKNSDIIGNKVLILDGIQDPGNLGTIIRSSVAFDVDTIILSDDTVDLYNPKVVRATEGMLFNINVIKGNLLEIIPNLKEKDYKIYGTNIEKGIDVKNVEKINKYAIIMGNEGNGIKEKINALCDNFIYIKMNSKCESLNVGVATSIILYELRDKFEN